MSLHRRPSAAIPESSLPHTRNTSSLTRDRDYTSYDAESSVSYAQASLHQATGTDSMIIDARRQSESTSPHSHSNFVMTRENDGVRNGSQPGEPAYSISESIHLTPTSANAASTAKRVEVTKYANRWRSNRTSI